jgi:PIN domain nuclease of toxin-antitoxin system
MRVLLDTCTFLWLVGGSPHLSKTARQVFADPGNDVYLSAASVWEIVVKHGLGRLPLPAPPEEFVPAHRVALGVEPLLVGEEAALHLSRLPNAHRDPFDRMLVAQALVGGLTLLTPDAAFRQYPAKTLW